MASLIAILDRHRADFHPVVPFDAVHDRLFTFDFTEHNTSLSPAAIANTDQFATWINHTLHQHHARYGIGGYGEHRTLYARRAHFDQPALIPRAARGAARSTAPKRPETDPRRLHLGVDIWGPSGTKVMAPLDGILHSFAFNNNDSDYGATIILTHNLDGASFH